MPFDGASALLLPGPDKTVTRYTLQGPKNWPRPNGSIRCRIAYAAAHVVAAPLTACGGSPVQAVDWDATLAYRQLLWSYGLAVAEAMDTAQRGMGLGWDQARELIRRSASCARAGGGRLACGAGTDQLAPLECRNLDEVSHAYEEQCAHVEACGATIILMASRALAACAASADDYYRVYERILRQVSGRVILHWLGEMFDPALAGYWGFPDVPRAMNVCLSLIRDFADKIDGIKISLLDARYEIEMRNRLPAGVRMYTGDDFHYDELIEGDANGFSDALLGIFDPIAPAASAALQALDRDDRKTFRATLEPTVELSRTIFESPTFAYKTGIVFLSWLNGYQRHFRMLGGQESARSLVHLSRVFIQADRAGLLLDPGLAIQRMRLLLNMAGL